MHKVKLHPVHGLNPTLAVCFWCGDPTDEMAFLGAAIKERAASHSVVDYTPCRKCQAAMADGILCMEVDDPFKLKRPALGLHGPLSALAPTGRWVVLPRDSDFFKTMIPLKRDPIFTAGRTMMMPDTFEVVFAEELANARRQADELRAQAGPPQAERLPGGSDRRDPPEEPLRDQKPTKARRPPSRGAGLREGVAVRPKRPARGKTKG